MCVCVYTESLGADWDYKTKLEVGATPILLTGELVFSWVRHHMYKCIYVYIWVCVYGLGDNTTKLETGDGLTLRDHMYKGTICIRDLMYKCLCIYVYVCVYKASLGANWDYTTVRTQEKACSSDSRFRRKLSGTTGHRLLGTQRPQMLCVAAWAWFCLSTEFVVVPQLGGGRPSWRSGPRLSF